MSPSSRRRPRGGALRAAAIAMGSLSVLTAAQVASASNTIVTEPFGATWTPGTQWALSGSYTPQIVSSGTGVTGSALRLTPAQAQQVGVISYTTPQPTSGGLDVKFVIAEWGGSGADGISFFLRKGSNPSNAAGFQGGALGYAPYSGSPGMPGGLIGIGFDAYGSYPISALDGTGCPANGNSQTPNSVTVRGPGDGTAGYCTLNSPYVLSGASALNNGSSTRADRARSVRVTVDPAGTASPKVKVYFGNDGSGATGASPIITVDAPAELLAEPTFKFGFAAATGTVNNNNEVWGLTIASLVDLPPVEITTTSLPAGAVGTAYSCTTVTQQNGVAPVAFAISSGTLPPGLTLNPTTGEVCGTPTTAGTYAFTVSATDSRGPAASIGTKAYSITIPGQGGTPEPEAVVRITGTPTTTLTAVLVPVTTARPGLITVIGSSREAGRLVTRCLGRARADQATTRRVACLLTPVARRVLCTRPLRLRLLTRLATEGRPVATSTRSVRVAKRNCAPRVTG